ncbi:peptidoglycan/xylan/chitin deacetylase (PgdA/CDA1 family) [Arthrobacter sp. CAN_A2]|uniref:polysaccharide deacetylase family protein n=1 Tax=Arthrobacter sp. CAN_A2 TaxID=2787718 RepID=UPI0018EFCE98
MNDPPSGGWSGPVQDRARGYPVPPRPGVAGVLVLAALLLCGSGVGASPAHSALRAGSVVGAEEPAPRTIVSLTFDDGNDDQFDAARVMDDHGLKGTFYVPSGLLADEPEPGDPPPTTMTVDQVRALQADGHEIGGHTVTHQELTTLAPEEARRQICKDRNNLIDLGLRVTSFAYPFGAATGETERLAAECGYNSARALGDLLSPDVPGAVSTCAGCPVAETMPPADPFRTRAPNQQENTWTLADLQDTVTNAETTGGWLQLTFHHVDDTGSALAVPPSVFEAFVVWLAAREESGTVVRTVDEVVGGPVKAAVDSPAPPRTGNLVRNAGLEALAPDGSLPACWQKAGFGENQRTFALEGAPRTGEVAAQVSLSDYVDGDAKLVPTMDLGTCAPAVDPTRAYDLGVWYRSSGETQFEIYTRDWDGTWSYWASSPAFPASDEWSHATFTTPAVPEGIDGMSFGLNVMQEGTLETDDYSLETSLEWSDYLGRSLDATWTQLSGAVLRPMESLGLRL